MPHFSPPAGRSVPCGVKQAVLVWCARVKEREQTGHGKALACLLLGVPWAEEEDPARCFRVHPLSPKVPR